MTRKIKAEPLDNERADREVTSHKLLQYLSNLDAKTDMSQSETTVGQKLCTKELVTSDF